MVGITSGQSVRINVTNTGFQICPCNRVVLTFRGPNGQLLRNRNGEVIRRSVELSPGESTFLDVDYGDLPPSPIRLQLRAVVTVHIPPPVDGQPPPTNDLVPTLEVINNTTSQTIFVMPGATRSGLNLQPNETLVRDVQNRER
jgi:hypothetical protein